MPRRKQRTLIEKTNVPSQITKGNAHPLFSKVFFLKEFEDTKAALAMADIKKIDTLMSGFTEIIKKNIEPKTQALAVQKFIDEQLPSLAQTQRKKLASEMIQTLDGNPLYPLSTNALNAYQKNLEAGRSQAMVLNEAGTNELKIRAQFKEKIGYLIRSPLSQSSEFNTVTWQKGLLLPLVTCSPKKEMK